MAQGPQNLPNDIDELKALVRARDNHIALLEEKLRLASLKRFGARSEKANADQLGLFNEAEATMQEPADASTSRDTPLQEQTASRAEGEGSFWPSGVIVGDPGAVVYGKRHTVRWGVSYE